MTQFPVHKSRRTASQENYAIIEPEMRSSIIVKMFYFGKKNLSGPYHYVRSKLTYMKIYKKFDFHDVIVLAHNECALLYMHFEWTKNVFS